MKTYSLVDTNEYINGNIQYILVPSKDERANSLGYVTEIEATNIYEAYGILTAKYDYPDYSLVLCRKELENIFVAEKRIGSSIAERITDRVFCLRSSIYCLKDYIEVNEDSTELVDSMEKLLTKMIEESREWNYKAV